MQNQSKTPPHATLQFIGDSSFGKDEKMLILSSFLISQLEHSKTEGELENDCNKEVAFLEQGPW